MAEEYKFIVEKKYDALRLDQYIVARLDKRFSRSFIQGLIRDGNVYLNKKKPRSSNLVKEKDSVYVLVPPAKKIAIEPEPIPIEIIFEDEDILVLNKPSGLVVHPAVGNYSSTLVNALLFHTKNLSSIDPNRPGIVHRLDKDTSGVMVVAKNNTSHTNLSRQFRSHKVLRKYIALVKGRVEFDEGCIDLPLTKDKRDFRKIKVGFVNSKKALTRYKVLKRYKDFTCLEIFPQTGRTHQIRVHLAFIGHPILGDTRYTDSKKEDFPRLALHALTLGFYHPTSGKFLEFSSSIPEEFKIIM